jgi:hypothetical protein
MKRPHDLQKFSRPKPVVSDLEKIAIKIITKKDFDKNSLTYYREQFIYDITKTFNIEKDEKITLKKLVESIPDKNHCNALQ